MGSPCLLRGPRQPDSSRVGGEAPWACVVAVAFEADKWPVIAPAAGQLRVSGSVSASAAGVTFRRDDSRA